MTPAHSVPPTSQQGQNPSMPPLPHEAMTHIAPLLSGVPFLAMHGYQRRGTDLSLFCRFPAYKSTAMLLRVYSENARPVELDGISFLVEFVGAERPARVVTLDAQGFARIDGIGRRDRVLLTLDVTK